MPSYHPGQVIAFHSCDREVGLKVLNGKDVLQPSVNNWDWLGDGIYFWEENPGRALEYAVESSLKKQFNLVPIKVPFVLGAVIDLGNCLNLVEAESLQILSASFESLMKLYGVLNEPMPVNKGKNRALDCAVIKNIHQSNIEEGQSPYDTVRCAFPEGKESFEGSAITSQLHIQIAVRNPEMIKGIFLPQPIEKYNPNLR